MKRSRFFKLFNFYPPFLGAGIRLKFVSDDVRTIEVEMKLRPWNRNYVGTQFGGSLYSMTDPFYMLMLMENLGREYIVWDKAATIRFKKPGRGRVNAKFELTAEQICQFKAAADGEYKIEPVLHVNVVDETGEIIAEVEKTIYIRRKDRASRKAE